MQNNIDFLKNLRNEIIKTQERRSNFVRQKLSFVTSLLGIGSISFGGEAKTSILLYLSPIIAFVFDLYIFGEDFNIKRAGSFLGRKDSETSKEEKEWEKRCRQNRNPFSQVANPLLSILVLTLSSIILFPSEGRAIIYWNWLRINIVAILSLLLYKSVLSRKIQQFE